MGKINEFKKIKYLKQKLIILCIILALILPGLYNGMKIVYYPFDSALVSSWIRIALVTDLHSCRYGKGEQKLIDAIDEKHPDVILLGGDIFDDKLSSDNTEAFLKGISGRYPIYYVTGNHEYWSTVEKFNEDMAMLDRYGVIRLQGQVEIIEINGEQIAISGVDDPDSFYIESDVSFYDQLDAASEGLPEDTYSILLTHRPELYNDYLGRGFDLVLAGHAHGGQWRFPWSQNGLFAPNQGLFPDYSGGLFSDGATTMIVSRGLARESTPVPRLYNRPELVVIDIM
ncbi:MAG: metallophosphoesterase [Clostridiales bacterium]|nr:metallophosphoesterase [Clostridiales bacterium]